MNNSDRNTYIKSFFVVEPRDEIEYKGEILELSVFGEYCPKNSLRGYQLDELLAFPNYAIHEIVVKGEAMNWKDHLLKKFNTVVFNEIIKI